MDIPQQPSAYGEVDPFAPSDDPPRRSQARPGGRWWLALVGLLTATLCLPFFRTVFWWADEGVLLHGAARMLQGSRLYADFFEFLPCHSVRGA